MALWFTNDSCNPFTDAGSRCTIGNYNTFAVNATSIADYQTALTFTKRHTIRLTIRNTGHDYFGKSTGLGAVSIWTHNMKEIKIIDYQSSHYTGKAMKMGAGVQVIDMYQAAYDAGLIMVRGDCPSVGVVGGYSQGGGHGPLASRYGLAADQVLEWEVVLTSGEAVTVTPSNEYSDLFWALAGGGGGTYAVVYSLTSKAYPDTFTSAANLSFSVPSLSVSDLDTFYDAFGLFQSQLPTMVDGSISLICVITNNSFTLAPATAPGVIKETLDANFKPILNMLKSKNISHVYYSQQNPTFLESYQQMTLVYPWDTGQYNVGGRMVPRSLVESNNSALTTAIREVMAVNPTIALSGFAVDVSRNNRPDAVGANPYWREMIIDIVIGTDYDYTDWQRNAVLQAEMTDQLLPPIERLTPNRGAYMNEADFHQVDYRSVFYGDHYDRLLSIKDKYDPEGLLYALTAVGSERWDVGDTSGRLCRR
ncbi:MAG: hypothetical protein M1822_008094 [Bathelium mastoideum]|nr:MAG: hypothetical protein M1822_008094 [Bathelium mastoideum]